MQSKRVFGDDGTAPTLQSGSREGGGIQPCVMQSAVALQTGHTEGNGSGFNTDNVSYTLSLANDHAVAFAQNTRNEVRLQGGDGQVTGPIAASDSAKGQGVPFVAQPITGGQTTVCMASGQANAEVTDDNTSPTITCLHEQPIICMADDNQNAAVDENLSGTLKVGGGLPIVATRGDDNG